MNNQHAAESRGYQVTAIRSLTHGKKAVEISRWPEDPLVIILEPGCKISDGDHVLYENTAEPGQPSADDTALYDRIMSELPNYCPGDPKSGTTIVAGYVEGFTRAAMIAANITISPRIDQPAADDAVDMDFTPTGGITKEWISEQLHAAADTIERLEAQRIDPADPEQVRVVKRLLVLDGIKFADANNMAPRILAALAEYLGREK